MSQPMTDAGSWSDVPRAGGGFTIAVGALLALAALATAAVGLWVYWVCATVLPGLHAKRIPMWITVASCFMGFSALSWVAVATGGRNRGVRTGLGAVSAVAVGLGSWAVLRMIHALTSGEDFEGYIILMGMAVTGHGVVGLIYSLLPRRPAPRPPTP